MKNGDSIQKIQKKDTYHNKMERKSFINLDLYKYNYYGISKTKKVQLLSYRSLEQNNWLKKLDEHGTYTNSQIKIKITLLKSRL